MVKRKTPDDRLKALEAKRAAKLAHQNAEPVVVHGRPGELPRETAERIRAEGRKAACLVVPTFESPEQWERASRSYHEWIAKRCERIHEPDYSGPTAEEIESAYRKSLSA